MSRTVLLGLAVIVVGAVVALVVWMDDAPAPAGGGGATRDLATPGDEPGPMLLPEGGALGGEVEQLEGAAGPVAIGSELATPSEDPVDGAPVASLRGLVLHLADDTPVPDVVVRVHLSGGTDLPDEALAATTDADGAFTLSFDTAVEVIRVLVAAGEHSGGLVEGKRVPIPLGTEASLTLRVGQGGAVSGRVLHEDGTTVPGAVVHLWSRTWYRVRDDPPDRVLPTGADGSFRCEAAGPEFILAAAAEGLVCSRRIVGELAEGTRADDLVLVLAPEVVLVGQTVTVAGAPLPAVELTVDLAPLPETERITSTSGVYARQPAMRRALSGDDGRFRVEGLVPGEASVEANRDGYTTAYQDHDPESGPLRLVLERGTALAGVVLGADGRPVPGAALSVRGAGSQSSTSGDDGRFLIEGLEPSTGARLRVLALGHALQVVQPVEVSADETLFLEVRLRPALALAGHVMDADGAPVQGAKIAIEGEREEDLHGTTMIPRPTWERALGRSSALTDAAGAFRIDELYEGSYRLSARDPADPDLTGTWQVTAGSEDLELVLDARARVGVTLVGRVTDAHTGQPVTAFQVTPMKPMGSGGFGGTNHAFTDAEGRYLLSGLEPGPYRLNATAEGYAPASHLEQEYAEGEYRIDMELRPMRSLHLRCVDPAGVALEGVSLTFLDEDGEDLMVATGPGSRSSMLSTDDGGEALAHELPAGRVTVRAQASGVSREDAHEVVFDLWNALPGVQTLVVPLPDPADRPRRLQLSLGAAAVDPGVPVFSTPEEQREALMPLVRSGKLGPLSAEVSVTYSDASGETWPPRLFGALSNGGWGETTPGSAGSQAPPGSLTLDITPDGGSLLIEASGHSVRRLEIPAGEGDLQAFVVLLTG